MIKIVLYFNFLLAHFSKYFIFNIEVLVLQILFHQDANLIIQDDLI